MSILLSLLLWLFQVSLIGFLMYFFLRLLFYVLGFLEIFCCFNSEAKIKFGMIGDMVEKIIYIPREFWIATEDGECEIDNDHNIQPSGTAGKPCKKYDVIIDTNSNKHRKQSLFEKFFSVVPIGLPPHNLKRYSWNYTRPPKTTDPKNDPGFIVRKIGDVEVVDRTSETNYLTFKFVYSLIASNIELKDQSKINIVGTITVQVYNVYRPVFTLDGEWFKHVIDACVGAIGDYCRELTISEFRQKIKGANNSEIENCVLSTKYGNTGTIATTGMGVCAFNFNGWEVTVQSKEMEKAIMEIDIAEKHAKATVTKAQGEADAITLTGTAKAKVARQLAEALKDNPEGAMVSATDAIGDAIRYTNATVVSLGSGIMPAINIPNKKESA